jgi:hypothetical protein
MFSSIARGKSRVLLPLFFMALSLWAQGNEQAGSLPSANGEPFSLVGMTLDELVGRFGAPRSVHAARGIEEWQDDVVFVYEHGDYYVYRDRVWQLALKSVMGVKAGDSRAAVSLVLGSKAVSRLDSIFYPLDGRSWPMTLRCDFDKDGRLLLIFIYRTDM